MRGMTQPHFRAGIGFGDWVKPWERMSEREKQVAVIGRVKETLIKKDDVSMAHWTCSVGGQNGMKSSCPLICPGTAYLI